MAAGSDGLAKMSRELKRSGSAEDEGRPAAKRYKTLKDNFAKISPKGAAFACTRSPAELVGCAHFRVVFIGSARRSVWFGAVALSFGGSCLVCPGVGVD